MVRGTVRTLDLVDLRRVLDDAVQQIDGAAHASIVLLDDGQWSTIVSTHPRSADLTAVDRDFGGPIGDVLGSRRVTRISSTRKHHLWPVYVQACEARGIHSVAAAPIADDDELVGALSIASYDHFGFAPEDTRIVLASAARAAGILRGDVGTDGHRADWARRSFTRVERGSLLSIAAPRPPAEQLAR